MFTHCQKKRGGDTHTPLCLTHVEQFSMDESKDVPTKTLQELQQALLLSYIECTQRGLLHSANW